MAGFTRKCVFLVSRVLEVLAGCSRVLKDWGSYLDFADLSRILEVLAGFSKFG